MERGNDAWKINGNNTKDHYTTGLEKGKLYLLSGPIHCTSPQAQSRTKRRHGVLGWNETFTVGLIILVLVCYIIFAFSFHAPRSFVGQTYRYLANLIFDKLVLLIMFFFTRSFFDYRIDRVRKTNRAREGTDLDVQCPSWLGLCFPCLESLEQIWERDTDQVRVRDVIPRPKPCLTVFFSRGSGRPGNPRVRSRLPKAKRNYGDLSPNSEADDIESETVISSIPRKENSSQTWVPSVFTSEIDITVVGVGHKTIVDEASAWFLAQFCSVRPDLICSSIQSWPENVDQDENLLWALLHRCELWTSFIRTLKCSEVKDRTLPIQKFYCTRPLDLLTRVLQPPTHNEVRTLGETSPSLCTLCIAAWIVHIS